jgi:hypothetical protein
MIEPGDRLIDCLDRGRIGRRRPADHDHVDAERARRGDLAVGGVAAAVLRDDDVDRVRAHQRAVARFAERTARGDVGNVRQRQRWIDGIDTAKQITMLRRAGKGLKLAAAERDEDFAAVWSDGGNRGARVADLDPAVAGDGRPRRPLQRYKSNAGRARGGGGVLRHNIRIRMRGVDQRIDALGGEMIREGFRAAKAADAKRYGMGQRRSRAAGERQRHIEFGAYGEPFGQMPRFGGAAENEDFGHAAA